jgi:hypothetical protein
LCSDGHSHFPPSFVLPLPFSSSLCQGLPNNNSPNNKKENRAISRCSTANTLLTVAKTDSYEMGKDSGIVGRWKSHHSNRSFSYGFDSRVRSPNSKDPTKGPSEGTFWVYQQHPSWYLSTFLSEWGLLVPILSPKNVRFELKDPGLGYAWDICNF